MDGLDMIAQQVVRWCRAIARCAAALADELEQTTTEPDRAEVADAQDVCEVGDPDPTPLSGYRCQEWEPTECFLTCTRAPHRTDQQHVAGGLVNDERVVLAVWTGAATSQPDNAPAPGWEMST